MGTQLNRSKGIGIKGIFFYTASALIVAAIVVILSFSKAYASQNFYQGALEFDNPLQPSVDLSQFFQAGLEQPPGVYAVYVFVNGESRNKLENINFVIDEESKKLVPELTPAMIKDWGVNMQAFPALQELPENQVITDITKYIPYASTHLQFNLLRLEVSIPQAAMASNASGWVDPEKWDEGVPAARLNYSISGYTSVNRQDGVSGDRTQSQYYGNFQTGLNLGPWRFKNYSTWSYDENNGSRWRSANAWLQRNIKSLNAQLVLGDSYTPGDIFNSVQFRGVQISSDDNMIPESRRGYAPEVRGIAKTNALVTIAQNNYIIYRRNVAPGPFVVNDIYPTTSGGDLTVTVKEADGSEHSFIQPFSSVPRMLRVGRLTYTLTVGEYRSSVLNSSKPKFFQATGTYGVSNWATIFGGAIGAEKYRSLAMGVGVGMGKFGSLSVDITGSMARLPGAKEWKSGQSYRAQYSKNLLATGTSINLAAYRYSTRDYYSLQDASDMPDSSIFPIYNRVSQRSNIQLNLSQTFANSWGTASVSVYRQNYWNQRGSTRTISAAYTNVWKGIGYGLYYAYSTNPASEEKASRQLSLNVQIPLDRVWKNTNLSYGVTTNQDRDTQHQVSLTGTVFDDNRLSWGVQQDFNNHNQVNNTYLNGYYKGAYGSVNAGYGYNRDQQQFNYTVNGGVLVHPYGVTLSQPLENTLALVNAPGAANTAIQNYPGIKTNAKGHAIVPSLGTYRYNRIALDTLTLGDTVDLDTPVQDVVPTEGALVVANFKTRLGYRLFMYATHKDVPLPFGATAKLLESGSNGMVGQDGSLYLMAAPMKGTIDVKWNKSEACTIHYDVSADQVPPRGIYRLNTICE